MIKEEKNILGKDLTQEPVKEKIWVINLPTLKIVMEIMVELQDGQMMELQ